MMTEEDRILLLKDLCCRVPYGTMVEIHGSYDDGEEYIRISELDAPMVNYVFDEEKSIKPYLRPMSSMTDEEKEDFGVCIHIQPKRYRGYTVNCSNYYTVSEIDWLNENHFDYRGLIEKGLAIEVTDENNPYA